MTRRRNRVLFVPPQLGRNGWVSDRDSRFDGPGSVGPRFDGPFRVGTGRLGSLVCPCTRCRLLTT